MRPIFTLLAGATLILASCSSSHKTQSSDDPYYTSTRTGASAQTDYYSTAPSDNYVQMKTVDQARWSTFDDYDAYDNYYASAPIGYGAYYGYGYPAYGFGFSPWSFGFGYGYPYMSIGMGFWNPYFGWNNYFLWNTCYNPYFYNPYYGGGVIYTKSTGYITSPAEVYTKVRTFNASTYQSSGFVNGNGNRFYRPAAVTSASSPYNSSTAARYNNNNRSFYRSSTPSNNGSYRPVGSFGGGSTGGSRGFIGSGGGGRSFGGGGRH